MTEEETSEITITSASDCFDRRESTDRSEEARNEETNATSASEARNAEETIPRAERKNPRGYNALQWAIRDKKVNDLIKDYPNVCPLWMEWIVDVIDNKPKEEIEKIILEGLWEKKLKSRQDARVIKGAMQIFANQQELLEYERTKLPAVADRNLSP